MIGQLVGKCLPRLFSGREPLARYIHTQTKPLGNLLDRFVRILFRERESVHVEALDKLRKAGHRLKVLFEVFL